jgi:hypothetical protein
MEDRMSTTDLSAAEVHKRAVSLEIACIIIGVITILLILLFDFGIVLSLSDWNGTGLFFFIFGGGIAQIVAFIAIGIVIGPLPARRWDQVIPIVVAGIPALLASILLHRRYGDTFYFGTRGTLVFDGMMLAILLVCLTSFSQIAMVSDAWQRLDRIRRIVLTIVVGLGLLIHMMFPLFYQ